MHVLYILLADINNACVEGITRKITDVVFIELKDCVCELRMYAKFIIIILYI